MRRQAECTGESNKRRVAVIGTGHRGAGTWGRELLATCGDVVDLVGLCDSNSLRLSPRAGRHRDRLCRFSPILAPCWPKAGPTPSWSARRTARMTITSCRRWRPASTSSPRSRWRRRAEKCRTHSRRRTPHRPPRRCRVQLPFRADRASRQGTAALRRDRRRRVGRFPLVSRRTARHGLFPPLARRAREFRQPVRAQGDASFRSAQLVSRARSRRRCSRAARSCISAATARFAASAAAPARTRAPATITSTSAKKPWLDMLYEVPSEEDGYFRDACVFREEIDIPDTMSAAMLYQQRRAGLVLAQHLHADRGLRRSPSTAIAGRIEVHHRERQPWNTPDHDEIVVMRNFGARRTHSRSAPERAVTSAAIRRCRRCCSSRASRPARAKRRRVRRCDLGPLRGRGGREHEAGAPVKVRPLLEGG